VSHYGHSQRHFEFQFEPSHFLDADEDLTIPLRRLASLPLQ
jgi:hypothetical protein